MNEDEIQKALRLARLPAGVPCPSGTEGLDTDELMSLFQHALLAVHALIEKQRAVVDAARLFVDMVESAERQRTVRGSKGMGASLPGEPLSYIQPSAFGELWKLRGLFTRALDTLASVGGEEGSK